MDSVTNVSFFDTERQYGASLNSLKRHVDKEKPHKTSFLSSFQRLLSFSFHHFWDKPFFSFFSFLQIKPLFFVTQSLVFSLLLVIICENLIGLVGLVQTKYLFHEWTWQVQHQIWKNFQINFRAFNNTVYRLIKCTYLNK